MAPNQATLDQGKVEEFFGKVVQDVAATLHAAHRKVRTAMTEVHR